jgi:hypothetical protein
MTFRRSTTTGVCAALLLGSVSATSVSAQKAKPAAGAPNTAAMLTSLDAQADHYAGVAKQI